MWHVVLVSCFFLFFSSGGLLTDSAVYKTDLCCDLCAQAICISIPVWACCSIVPHYCTVQYSTPQLSLCLAPLAQKRNINSSTCT